MSHAPSTTRAAVAGAPPGGGEWVEPPALASLSPEHQLRLCLTLACRDCDPLPKAPDAGRIFRRDGACLQIMHDGTLVPADGYCGPWMTRLIAGLHGHHEPQEELVFHALLSHARPDTLIVELGCWWAYYSAWYLAAVPRSAAVCIEPDAANLDVGRRTMAANGRTARFLQAFVGSEAPAGDIPCHDMAAVVRLLDGRPIELLHMDVQGAELSFLRSMARVRVREAVRFLVVSTHHASISGSATTHEDCLREIRELGGFVLAEHDVLESHSGDGLIVASFASADAGIALPAFSRASRELGGLIWKRSLFSDLSPRGLRQRLRRSAARIQRDIATLVDSLGSRRPG
jgi:hypothetical protein